MFALHCVVKTIEIYDLYYERKTRDVTCGVQIYLFANKFQNLEKLK